MSRRPPRIDYIFLRTKESDKTLGTTNLHGPTGHLKKFVTRDDQGHARQARDAANDLKAHPRATAIPATVAFDLITPSNVMNTIQT